MIHTSSRLILVWIFELRFRATIYKFTVSPFLPSPPLMHQNVIFRNCGSGNTHNQAADGSNAAMPHTTQADGLATVRIRDAHGTP